MSRRVASRDSAARASNSQSVRRLSPMSNWRSARRWPRLAWQPRRRAST
jgi:hypothetical protein